MSEINPYMHINLIYFTDGIVNFWGNSGLMNKHNWLPVELNTGFCPHILCKYIPNMLNTEM